MYKMNHTLENKLNEMDLTAVAKGMAGGEVNKKANENFKEVASEVLKNKDRVKAMFAE